MKTLVIHPKDPTTHFLDIVYRNIDDLTLITEGVSKDYIKEQIKTHDRVMMMGHGSPGGLFAVGQFDGTNGYIIDESMVSLLKEKDNSVFIWCNADRFVEKYDLKGFYTGMFISEVGEAMYCGLPDTIQDEVDDSNYQFVEIIGECIDLDVKLIHEVVTTRYGQLIDHNPVAKYNHERLYINQ